MKKATIFSPKSRDILWIVFHMFLTMQAVAQCPVPVNDASMVGSTSTGPTTQRPTLFDIGTLAAGSDATNLLLYINTVNHFDIPVTLSSAPTGNTTYQGIGQQLVANIPQTSSVQIDVDGLEPSTTYYYQLVKYTECSGSFTVNNSIVANQHVALTTSSGLSENITARDVVFGLVGTNNIPLNSFTGISQPVAPSGYVIKMNTSNVFTPVANGTSSASLTANTAYSGGEQIVYVGASNSPNIDITGLTPDTDYYFRIYGYQGTNYQQVGHTAIQSTTTIRPAASITLTGSTATTMTATYGDAPINLTASSTSSSPLIYQLVDGPYYTSLSGSVLTLGKAGTVLIDVIAPGDGSVSTAKERISITVNKATPTFNLGNVLIGNGTSTLLPLSDSDGVHDFATVGAANGNTFSGQSNQLLTGGTGSTVSTLRASVAASDYYLASFQDVTLTVTAFDRFVLSQTKLLRISNGMATTIVDFTANPTATGSDPQHIAAINGQVWGVTNGGGTGGKGLLFRVDANGSNFNIVGEFDSSLPVANPYFVQEISGKVWVVTITGGSTGEGALYTTNLDGTGFLKVHDFSNLKNPISKLSLYNGKIYGMTLNGGPGSQDGGVFSIDPDGSGYAIERDFEGSAEVPNIGGGIIIGDELWYANQTSTELWARNLSNAGNRFISISSPHVSLTQVDGALFGYASSQVFQVATPFTSVSPVRPELGLTINESRPFFQDELEINGIGTDPSTSESVLFALSKDGKLFSEVYRTSSETLIGTPIRLVQKLTPSITFSNQSVNFGSGTLTLAASTTSTAAITYELIGDLTGATLVGNQLTLGNAGTITVRASVAATDDFNAASQDATVTVNRINPTASFSDITADFAGANVTLAPTSTNYSGGTISYQFVNGGSLSATGPNTGSTISGDQLTLGNSGTETIRASFPTSTNYNAATFNFQLTINNATADLSGFTDFAAELFQSDVTLSVSSAPGVSVSYELLTSNTGSSLSGTNNEILTVGNMLGTETIRVTVNQVNYLSTTKDVTLTLERARPVITWTNPADIEFAIVPLTATQLNATTPVAGSFTYWIGAAQTGIPIVAGTTTLPAVGPTTLTAEFTPSNATDYQIVTQAVAINATNIQLEVTITDQSINFGESDPPLTYTITDGALNPIDAVSVPLVREIGAEPGTYAITIDNTAAAPWNEDAAPNNCFGLCIRPPGVGEGTPISNGNYDITIVDGTFTIQEPTVTNQTVSTSLSSAVCEGSAAVSIPSSQLGVNYYLRDSADNLVIEGPVAGTGSGISFASETLTATKTYNVLAASKFSPTYSLELDNVDGYATIGSGINGQLNTEGITVETWAYIPTADDSDSYSALITNEFDGADITYQISINGGKILTGFLVSTEGWKWTSSGVGVDYPKDQWIHIASTYDRNHIRLYINGVEVDAVAETAALPITASNWRVGRRWDGVVAANVLFGGSLANTRIWNVARTASEIATNRFETISSATGLVASYTYTDGAGMTVADRTGNGFSATLQNLAGDATNWKTAATATEMTPTATVTINSIQDQTVTIAQPSTSLAIVSLAGSQLGVRYSLRDDMNNSVLQGPIDGTGVALAFASESFAAEKTFNVWAESISGTCTLEMGNTVTAFPKTSITAGDIPFNAPASLVFSNTEKTYSVTPNAGLSPALPVADLDLTYEGRNGTVYASSSTAPINAGDYTVTATVNASNADYTGSVAQDFSITRASATISLNLPGTNPTYSGVSQGISPTANDVGGNPTLVLVTEYSPQGANTYSTTLPVNAGTYDVRVNLNASETNYMVTEATGTFIIDKAPLTARLDDATIVYGTLGANNAPVTYIGFLNGETSATSLTVNAGWPTVEYFNNSGMGSIHFAAGGPYSGAVRWAAGVASNITSANYALTFEAGDLTSVTARPITITADARTITYGDDANTGNNVAFEAYNESNGSGLATTESASDFTGTVTFATITEVNAGTYTDVITPNGGLTNSNYAITFVAGDLIINQATLSVKAQNINRDYGASNPAVSVFEYSGFTVAGDGTDGTIDISTLTGLSGTAVGTIDAGATSNANAGTTYGITVDVSGISSTNYTFTADNSGSLTIDQRGVTVTADAGQSKIYGQSDPVAFAFTPTPALETGDSFTGALSRTTGENVGTYTIGQGTLTAGSNYAITFVSNDFTIGTRALTVTADPQNKTYGDLDPTLTYQVTSGALQFSDAFTGSLARVAGENIGTYAINQGTLSAGGNYALIFVSDDLTIGTRAITVTADAQGKTYGDLDPLLTYQITSGALQGSDMLTGSLTRVAGENAGTYAINQGTLAASANYALSYMPANLTIGTRAITITADDKNKTVGQADPALTFTVTSGALQFSDAVSGSLTRVAGETVGTYAINQGSVGVSANYNQTFVPGTLTITDKIIQTISFNALADVTYGDATFTLSATGGASGNPVTFASSNPAVATVSGTTVTIVGAGMTNITASQVGDVVYADAADVVQPLTVNTRVLEVTADAQSKIYGDADPGLTWQLTSGSLVTGDAITGNPERIVGENAGTYAINQGTLDAGSNYNLTFIPANLSIGTRAITVVADTQSKTYGDADPTLTYQITSGALQGSDVFTGSLERIAGEDAGTYSINQGTLALNANYALTYVPADLTISARALEITADAQSKTYGDTDPAFTYQITGGALQGGDVLSGSLSRAIGEDAGTYAINQGNLDAGSNYVVTYVAADLTIGTRAITVTVDAQTKTYGDADPMLTYQLTSGALQFTDAFSGTLSRAAGENVGTYVINQGSLDVGGNYVVTYIPANLTINTRAVTVTADVQSKIYGDSDPSLTYQVTIGSLQMGDVFAGSLTRDIGENVGSYAISQGSLALNANYNLTYIGNSLTISQRDLTITADDQIKTTGTTDPALTYRITSGALQFSDIVSGSLSRNSGETAGTYMITQGTLDVGANYNLTFVQGVFTITDLITQAITFNPLSDVTYGDAAFALTATGGGSGNPVTYVSSNTSVATVSGSIVTIVGVGTTNITASQAGDATHAPAVDVVQSLTVNRATLTVTADDQTRAYAASNPTLAASYSGFVNGEDASVLTIQPMLSTIATATSDVGTYPITVSGASADNYDLMYVNGTLTITKATQTITFDALNDVDISVGPVSLAATASSNLAVTYSLVSGPATLSGSTLTLTGVGVVEIAADQAGNNNYEAATQVIRSFAVSDGSIMDQIISFNALANVTYGAAVFDPGATASSGLTVTYTSSDETVATVSGSMITIVGAGTTTITASQAGNATFNAAPNVSQILTVDKAPLTITADDQTINEGEAVQSLTFSGSGFVNGEDISVIDVQPNIGSIANLSSLPGTYEITLTGGSDDNYELTLVNGTLTILQVLSVEIVETIKVYPNPITDYVIVESRKATILEIYAQDGRLLKEISLKAERVDLADLRIGLYLMQLKDEAGEVIHTTRLVKKNN